MPFLGKADQLKQAGLYSQRKCAHLGREGARG